MFFDIFLIEDSGTSQQADPLRLYPILSEMVLQTDKGMSKCPLCISTLHEEIKYIKITFGFSDCPSLVKGSHFTTCSHM